MRIAFLTFAFYGLILPILVNPFWGIVYFLFISILRPEQLAWGETFGRLHLLVALVTIVSWLMNSKSSEVRGLQKMPLPVWLMGGVYLATILATLTAYDPDVSAEFSSRIGKALLFGFLVSRLVDRHSRIQRLIRTITLAAGALTAWGIQQFRVGNVRLEGLSSAFSDSNVFALTMAMLVPMVIAAARHDTRPWKLLGFSSSGFMLMAIVLSHSRGALLALLSIAVTALIQSRRLKMALSILGIAGLLAVLAPATWWQRMDTITVDEGEMDQSAHIRVLLWNVGLRVFAKHPLLGVGLENFPLAKNTVAEEFYSEFSPPNHALIFGIGSNYDYVLHNTYLNAMAEGGLVLFLPFAAFLLSGICWRLPRHKNRSELPKEAYASEAIALGIRLGLIGFYVGAFFLNGNYIELLYWQVILAGVVVAMIRQRAQLSGTQGLHTTDLARIPKSLA